MKNFVVPIDFSPNSKSALEYAFVLAKDNLLPESVFMDISETYLSIANTITDGAVSLPENPKSEIIDVLNDRFGIIE